MKTRQQSKQQNYIFRLRERTNERFIERSQRTNESIGKFPKNTKEKNKDADRIRERSRDIERFKSVLKTNKNNKEIEEQISPSVLSVHCNLCKRPFTINSEQTWKKLCVTCYLKVNGKVVDCSICKQEFLTKSNDVNNFCYQCTLGMNNGLRSSCGSCKKHFYTKDNQKKLCYDCYIVKTGQEISCKSCDTKIYVKPENMSWQKRCFKCYIHNE